MSELHYAFIKDNRVKQVIVVQEEDIELANRVVEEREYDLAVWLGDNNVAIYSHYDGETFTPPTLDYLYSIGAWHENQAMKDARILAEREAENPA